jgi:hypothetical protein
MKKGATYNMDDAAVWRAFRERLFRLVQAAYQLGFTL